MNNRLISVKEYSEQYKISKQAIYSKIQRGILKVEVKDNIKYIIVNIEQHLLNENNTTKSEGSINTQKQQLNNIEQHLLNEKIKNLEELLKKEVDARERAEADKKEIYKQLDIAANEKKELLERNREQNHLIMQSQKNYEVLQLEYTNEKSKTWIQRLFKK